MKTKKGREMICLNLVESAGRRRNLHTHTHTHTHTQVRRCKAFEQIGTICFAKFFKFCAVAFFAIVCMFVRIDSAMAVDYPFSVTTSDIAANGTFYVKLSAKGTFYVDCGDGGTLSGTGVSGGTITKNNTTEYTYTCTYSSAGTKTIQFGGTATAYNTDRKSVV